MHEVAILICSLAMFVAAMIDHVRHVKRAREVARLRAEHKGSWRITYCTPGYEHEMRRGFRRGLAAR